MGFESHIVARLNYYDKGWMQQNKQLEFVWRPSASLYATDGVEIFTHIMDQYQYSSPGIPLQTQLKYLCAPPHNQTSHPSAPAPTLHRLPPLPPLPQLPPLPPHPPQHALPPPPPGWLSLPPRQAFGDRLYPLVAALQPARVRRTQAQTHPLWHCG